ncbi:MAG: TonB-dependent receptor plug domain-containing protein [Lutibacter sp.]|uniref:TonB-dependent receptor n=1 Tax=Lutibacter sp. TaxID=1925666 RepID=UPI001A0D38B7|nr:carboxypeptidase-like regulatory domain-containing protein [Lutibacter sp.]NOR27691.1 TonB-dependent receptor plug domain-containing protein [Lutibacter sp.]
MRNFKNWLVIVMLISTSVIFAQTKLTGKVVDETNQPLPGATVVLQGTQSGASSDFDGNFTFETTSANGTILVSFVGYQTKSLSFNGNKDFGTISLDPSSESLEEIVITATSFAVDRKTPVAVSTIKAEAIEVKLGTQEFPEILKSTPGVYATKAGGGYGDSRINLRGFESNNIGVLINGVPVNDMENGRVYWSNWAGLADVTSAMQVQRGLGASKVAVPSIGGTINIISKSTDVVKGGNITMSTGNDGYKKYGATLSTGLMENGFAATVSAAKIYGDGYVDGTQFDGYNYFLNLSKEINDQHKISFTAFGAQQVHGQRYNRRTIAQNRATEAGGQRYNPDWGYKNGEVEHISYNFYHKPQMSLNHYWYINDNTNLSTAVYASFGSGGGRRTSGSKFNDVNYRIGDVDTPINFDKIVEENKANGALGSTDILSASMNSHQWIGILSTLKTELSDKLTLSGGLDGRYYVGSHWYEVKDLLGGQFFHNTNSSDNTYNQALKVGDRYNKDYDGKVIKGGIFGQLEYAYNDDVAIFLSSAISNTTYSKIDFMKYASDDPNRISDKADFLGYSVKGGANYNINETSNVFVNIGSFSKAPFLTGNVFQSTSSTTLNPDALNEKVFSAEIGYGYRSSNFAANLNVYNTSWVDKSLTGTVSNPDPEGDRLAYNIPGLDALHMGIEFDFRYNASDNLTITGMASLGDWKWKNDVTGTIFDEGGNALDDQTVDVYAKDLKVSDAAQTTFALGFNYNVLPTTFIYVDYNYAGNIYARYDINGRGLDDEGLIDREDSWEMPDYHLVDLGLNHKFAIGDFKATLNAKMNNIFDVVYVSDAFDGSSGNHDETDATVYYGAGRTFSVGMKIKF